MGDDTRLPRKLVGLGVVLGVVETWRRERRGESGDDNRFFDACCDVGTGCFDWGGIFGFVWLRLPVVWMRIR